MINPLDVVARAAAIPAIVWSASNTLLGLRRKWTDDPASSLRVRLEDGLFERIEEQFQARWAKLFPTDDDLDRAA